VVTEHELRQICRREGVTPSLVERRPGMMYWYGFRRVAPQHDGGKARTHSVYLVAQSRLADFTEAQLLDKIAQLPQRSDSAEPLQIEHLPGGAVQIKKAGKQMILNAQDLARLVS
jgi:hypothetical protein